MPVRWRRVVSPPASLAMARRNCSALSWLAAPTSSVVVLMVPSSRISITSLSISISLSSALHHSLPATCGVSAPLKLPAELSRLALHRLLRVGALDLVQLRALSQLHPAGPSVVGARCPAFSKDKHRVGHTIYSI